jgi:hypothetical protein
MSSSLRVVPRRLELAMTPSDSLDAIGERALTARSLEEALAPE